MTSPAGLGFPEPDILARWTPSRTRAGVILHPSPDLAGSLRYVTAKGPAPQMPEDSFASDFAPLSASTDSSLIGAEGCERPVRGDVTYRPTNCELSVPTAILQDQFDKLDAMANEDLPIMMKLEQLRKWQQEMQKQLEAHQLEELLCLQEEQQRLLGIGNDPHRLLGESTELSEPEWDEETVHSRPDVNSSEFPRAASGIRPEQQLSIADGKKELSKDQEDGMRDTKQNDWRRRGDGRAFPEVEEANQECKDAASAQGRNRKGDQVWNDRPIRPGIVGQKQTFEELLDEQLRLEEQRLKSAQQQNQAPPKRAFLKRGEGLARFTKNSKALSKKAETRTDQKSELQARVITRSNSAPASIHRGFSNSSPRLPVQRKTAILNKENELRRVCPSPREIRADGKPAWTKVLGTHQRQNKEEVLKTKPESGRNKNALLGLKNEENKNKVGFSDQGQRSCAPNPVTKQVGTMEARGNADGDATKSKSSGSTVEATPLTEKEGGVPQDSFEMSFQEKLRRWECDKQLENMELGEFELLEQAAEELSFSSNSSFVTKVLRMDQQKWQLQTAHGLHQRRLSSTPIKSPPRGDPQKCGSVERDAVSVCKSGSAASEEKKSRAVDKVSAEDDDGEDSGREDQRELSDISSAGGSDFGEQDVVLFPPPSNPPYDKRSYQEEDSFRDSASDGGEADSIHSYAEDSTLTEDKDSRQPDVIFDDDDAWNDLEVSAGGKTSDSTEVSLPFRSAADGGKPLMRKVATSKATGSDSGPEADPPPASQLMTRLFPSLKPKDKSTPAPPPPVGSESSQQSNDTVQQAQSRQLRERLVELEIEIERFKKENAALAKLRQDCEKKQEELRRERLDFDQAKAAELARFDDYKKEENRKLQKERKLFEKHATAARAAPDKKEREEIQSLKEQLNSLQEELKRRESRWTSTHTRLRQQIDSLNKDNAALREEIQMLEKLRLSAWKKSSVAAETKDGPRTSESSVSSGTKGVTFASPLDSIGSCSSPPAGSTSTGPKGNCKDSGQAGMKSSLRRSGGSTSSFSSSSLTSRKQEGRSSPVRRNQKPPQTLEESEESLKTEVVPEKPESLEANELDSVQDVIKHPDGKIEKVLVGGDRLIVFPNGTRKEVSADGLSVKITFFNGDTKQTTADQRVIYYYAEAQTTHITYPEGLEVLHFPNNQTEKHFPDGRKEITFPDQTVKNLFPDGREESVLTDGTIIRVNTDGIKEIHFNTGQKEVHTADFKRREYPDGTVKTVYNDGRQETRYPTGRVRIKDREGNVIMDKRP
ncbi:centromere protein J isoform X3 [Oryzias latipes]|uniref:centromere protein J isoform X3 n=1 Tax=Oryzias latipes TaxID=8090 RepID=UPI0005CBF613|nr:centromere protein J isoform X3 [Oryzias latipes]